MSRDPVTIAELERDFEETYGSREQQFADWWANQERLADLEYSSHSTKEKSDESK